MSSNKNNLKNSLRNSEPDPLDDYLDRAEKRTSIKQEEPEIPKPRKNYFGIIVLIVVGFFLLRGVSGISFNPISSIFQTVTTSQPSEDLLNRMNNRMVEMGYAGLNHDDLRDLRSKGVTATYISNVRALGFTDLTLDEAVSLAQADASSAFIAMMIELGYEPTVEDLVNLRSAGVTAFYTSNIHDLGYRDVTMEQLIRMQRIGVTTALIERLQEENGEDIPLEDIIRYRISNQ
ncbi:hypothetical protein [Rhodohalobacter barkolensis]|uniref:Uncharacterized protein n=1 Tax=Rhodohalobacter barkolensis TaxID=2053187 RepID=A0A2N0VEG5_9BACT|nr:hypothetical protein [Rhodohalobacter barkolensis]PKD42577.1 hypothetical protein CWD77_14295 [Rhodohalobacter barkolensis]